jgi:GNAT superfamily N-acetyltransferase
MERVQIRPAKPDEGERLREIAIAAKCHWGYDPDRVRRWAADGDFTPRGLRDKDAHVAALPTRVIGWSGAIARSEVWWLDDLWVEPEWLGHGVGSRLFLHVVERARAAGARRLEWEAERNAVGFYERMGGCFVRAGEPTDWGPPSPIMSLDL